MTSGSMQLVILILCLVVVSVQGQNSLQDSSRSSGSEPSVHDLERHIESDNTSDVFAQTVGVEFDDILNEEESKRLMGFLGRPKRSVGYDDDNYGSRYVDYIKDYDDRYGRYLDGHDGTFGGYPNKGSLNYLDGHDGTFGGHPNKGSLNYNTAYTQSPILTFVKGFRPGKSYVEKGKVVRNYYRHGTYEVALQHYKFIPVIKVVPYTTYDTIGYTGHIQAHNDYTAVICKDCYHTYPKIDVIADKAPYNYLTRRFVYLPKSYKLDHDE